MVDGQLVIKGRVLDRRGNGKFRHGILKFLKSNYDPVLSVMHMAEDVEVPIDPTTGAFRVVVYPGTGDEAWVGQMDLTDKRGKLYRDRRTLPATGEVDWFTAPIAKTIDQISIAEGGVPILITDYNKPGGPLQLTDTGTIAESHIPGDFLRVDDDRIPELRNYVTVADYEEDQADRRRTHEIPFASSWAWEYDYSQIGIDYRPIVQTFESDGTELDGALSYPVGTTKVLVEWDAPTSGVLVLR